MNLTGRQHLLGLVLEKHHAIPPSGTTLVIFTSFHIILPLLSASSALISVAQSKCDLLYYNGFRYLKPKQHKIFLTMHGNGIFCLLFVSTLRVVYWLTYVELEICSLTSLQWRHNELDGVPNHRRLHYLLSCWFKHISKKTSKLRLTGLCVGNSPVTD